MLVPTGAEGKYEYDPSIPAGSGGGGGGGGGGDLSSATVTFINTALGKYYAVLFPTFEPGDPGLRASPLAVGDEVSVTTPLYKGVAYINPQIQIQEMNYDVMPTFTGGISLDDGLIKITGDGTITAAGTGTIT